MLQRELSHSTCQLRQIFLWSIVRKILGFSHVLNISCNCDSLLFTRNVNPRGLLIVTCNKVVIPCNSNEKKHKRPEQIEIRSFARENVFLSMS